MSTTDRPTDRPTDPSTDRPTASFPTAAYPTAAYPTAAHLAHLAHLEREEAAHRERLADLWADRTPTEELPAVGRPAAGQGRQARPSRARRHLRAALAGVAIAAALLTGLSLYAADGISSARRAAVEQARSQAARPAPQQATPAPTPTPAPAPSPKPVWTVHGTDAPYDRTDPHASPLDLPRCTTAPDTPMPCLAHVSADSAHAVVLEEDASLTGLDRR